MNLIDLSVRGLAHEVASASPAPGGGSMAALSGALGAALTRMVAELTLGKKKYADAEPFMHDIKEKTLRLMEDLLSQVDADTLAYQQVMAAYRLPKSDAAETNLRHMAVQAALTHAAQTPFRTLEWAVSILPLIELAVKKGNQNCVTDAGVAAEMTLTAVRGAAYNVLVNLRDLDNKRLAREFQERVLKSVNHVHERVDVIRKTVETAIGWSLEIR